MKEQNKITKHLHAYTLAHLNSCTHARLHNYTHTRLHALTLVELVIVCAIIALLLGIFWTLTSSVREKGRQIQCMNNLKQIHLALVMYKENWAITYQPAEGVLPHQLGLPVIPEYYDLLSPYLKDIKVFICPNDYEYPKTGVFSYVWHWPPYPYHGSPFLDGAFSLYKREVKCGERFVLLDCPWHGARQKTDSFYILLRWNGQVRGQYVKIPLVENPCWDDP